MAVNSKFQIPTARELFKSIPNAKYEWIKKTPLQKWCYFYSIGKIPFDFLRLPMFGENVNQVHWFAYCAFGYATITISLSSYTLYNGITNNDGKTSLASTCMAAVCLAVCNSNAFLNSDLKREKMHQI